MKKMKTFDKYIIKNIILMIILYFYNLFLYEIF